MMCMHLAQLMLGILQATCSPKHKTPAQSEPSPLSFPVHMPQYRSISALSVNPKRNRRVGDIDKVELIIRSPRNSIVTIQASIPREPNTP